MTSLAFAGKKQFKTPVLVFFADWRRRDWYLQSWSGDVRTNMADCCAENVVSKVRDILSPVGLESHPFKVN